MNIEIKGTMEMHKMGNTKRSSKKVPKYKGVRTDQAKIAIKYY